ncbi:MAG: exonuclease subunit SbcD [Bifidobacteriaceae bacterium]|jgi:exonuclease SbcD|nr:exonuclease subunit SbcD [Bifidobacteriaceae bacterium]
MRLIHTSDWHLGRSFHNVDLLDHHAAYTDHLVELVREVRPTAVLIAGDVYDRAVPPVGAVRLLEESLTRLAELTRVIVTAGNHDSATRLGFAAGLMRPEIQLITRLDQIGQAIELEDDQGGPGALVYPVPFLDVYAAADHFSVEEAPVHRSHEAVMNQALNRVRQDLANRGLTSPGAVAAGPARGSSGKTNATAGQSGTAGMAPATIVMAHAFVVGGQASESERDLSVGGIETVPADAFAGFDYAALGHLHGPQRIAAPDPGLLRYSGSPLAFSFSEANQTKSTAVITVGQGPAAAELIPAPVPRPLAQIRGTMAELRSAQYDEFRDHWVSVAVTDPARPDDMVRRVFRRFPHTLKTFHDPPRSGLGASTGLVTAASDPHQVVAQFIEYAGGLAATEPELREVTNAFEAITLKAGTQ